MFDRFKICITSNLISLFGYIISIGSIVFWTMIYPQSLSLEINHRDIFSNSDIVFLNYLVFLLILYILIIFLLIGYFIEQYLQETNKIQPLKFFKNSNKYKTLVFGLGCILVPLPIVFLVISFVFLLIHLFIHLP